MREAVSDGLALRAPPGGGVLAVAGARRVLGVARVDHVGRGQVRRFGRGDGRAGERQGPGQDLARAGRGRGRGQGAGVRRGGRRQIHGGQGGEEGDLCPGEDPEHRRGEVSYVGLIVVYHRGRAEGASRRWQNSHK